MEIIAIVVLIVFCIRIEMSIYKKRVLPNIIYDCHFSKPEVFEGDHLEIVETVMNPSSLFIPGIKAEITTSNHLEFANKDCVVNDKNRSLASLFAVHGKQRVTRRWGVHCKRRGWYKIQDTSIVGSDLFGAYHYSAVKRIKSELIVLPKPIDVSFFLQNADEKQGDYVVKRFILEDPFVTAGTREYTSRDPMNRIHWGSTARCGQLMVRNNEATAKKSITIIINMQEYIGQLREPIRDERIEWAIKIAAGELDKLVKESIPVRLLANGYVDDDEKQELVTTEMWGQAHIHDLMVLLARLGEVYSDLFDKFIMRYKESIMTTEVILITCYLDESMLAFIREKEQLGVVVKVYLMAYEADSSHYEDIHVYYLLDYLKEAGGKDAY